MSVLMKDSPSINMLSRTSQSSEPVIYFYKLLWLLLKKCFWVTYILKAFNLSWACWQWICAKLQSLQNRLSFSPIFPPTVWENNSSEQIMTEVVIRDICLCCDYDEQPLSELCRICWHLWFYRKIPRFRFHFFVRVSLTMEGQNHLSIRLALKYSLPHSHAVPPTAARVSRCPHQPFQLKGDDTGAHTNQVEQEYRDISSCHDI